ncbi:hypothetical protein JL722_13966 [Aureococcus anophagefferens]|nr:hypothetical protein JL722_13966 [Aureococcus anophagefferens]
MMALARAARRRLLPRGALRPTSRSAVTTTFLPENREWHEPAVLSAAAASFRDDELRLLDALAEAAAASLDRAVEASAAEACLDASVAAAGDGDAAALLADFAARATRWLRVAVALFPPGGDRYGAAPRRRAGGARAADAGAAAPRAGGGGAKRRRVAAARRQARFSTLRGPARGAARAALRHLDRNANDALDLPAKARCVAAWAEPDRRRPPEPPPVLSPAWFAHRGGADGRAYVRPAALAEATDEFFPEHAKLGKELATALLRHREQLWREHGEGVAYLTGAFCLFCAAADAPWVA